MPLVAGNGPLVCLCRSPYRRYLDETIGLHEIAGHQTLRPVTDLEVGPRTGTRLT